MKSIKPFFWAILRILKLAAPFQLVYESVLSENGWFKSYYSKQSVDKQGRPIPWCTYSFIYFIENRLQSNFTVFEYGSGNSSLWYASRVQKVVAVEHDQFWYQHIKNNMPANVALNHVEYIKGGDYGRFILTLKEQFDIVVIDGRDRCNALRSTISGDNLKKDGIIVLDNSDRASYQKCIAEALEKGFKKIDFWGLSPVTAHLNLTSIFYRSENCIGL